MARTTRSPETRTVKLARMRWSSYLAHFGPDNLRTITAARELAEARYDEAQAEADRLKALADAARDAESAAVAS